MTPQALLDLGTALSIAPILLEPHMTRERLPEYRDTETRDIVHTAQDSLGNTISQEFTISVGRYADGRIAEVFIEVPYQQRKFATALLGKDVATLISIALQHGATVDELNSAMGRSDMNRMGKIMPMPHTLIGTVLDAMTEPLPPSPNQEQSQ